MANYDNSIDALQVAFQLALVKYVFKVIIALIDTIFIYWARNWDMTDKDWNESLHNQPLEFQKNR